MQVLADHSDYRITLHRSESVRPSPLLVVTFDGQPTDLRNEGFGTALCRAQGWDNIYVAQRYGTQYQGLSVDDFYAAVSPLCEGRDVVCYGSSLGGYAALYFGGCLNARIIAAAPMLPAWRPLKNRAYADLPIHHLELCETPLSAKAPAIIYDPMREQDKDVVDRMVLKAYPSARLIEVPYGGHTVLITLSQAKLLKPITLSLLEHDEVIEFTPPGKGTAIWHAERGRQLIRQSETDAAIQELETSLSLQARKQTFCNLINALLRKNDLTAVQQKLDAGRGNPQLTVVPSLRKRLETLGLTAPTSVTNEEHIA